MEKKVESKHDGSLIADKSAFQEHTATLDHM